MMKLLKLLYYCQGYHLATCGRPLFREPVNAWDDGPIVLGVHHEDTDRRGHRRQLDNTELSTVGFVVSRYGHHTGRELADMTHRETPWLRANEHRTPGGWARIDQNLMRDYFREQIGNPAVDAGALEAFLAAAAARRGEPRSVDSLDELRRYLEAM